MKVKVFTLEDGNQIKLGEIELKEFSPKDKFITLDNEKLYVKDFIITDNNFNIHVSKRKTARIIW